MREKCLSPDDRLCHVPIVIQFFFLMKPFSEGLLLLLFSQIYSINVNNIFCGRYYVTIIFSTQSFLFWHSNVHRIPLSFTHEFILSTSPRELLLFTPRALPVQYVNFIISIGIYYLHTVVMI